MKRWVLTLLAVSSLFLGQTLQADAALNQNALKYGMGIRPLSMGGAFTAVAESGEGAFYNPAGVAMPGAAMEFQSMDQDHQQFSEFQAFHFYMSPLAYSRWSMSTDSQNKVKVNAYTLANRGKSGIDWGITYKAIHIENAGQKHTAWSGDVGLMFRLYPNLNVGVVGKDILQKDLDVESSFATGVQWRPMNDSLMLTADVSYLNGSGSDVNAAFGAEYEITPGFLIRAGYNEDFVSAGGELKLGWLSASYGAMFPEDGSDATLMFGVRTGPGPIYSDAIRRKYAVFKPKAYAGFRLSGNLVSGRSEVSILGGQKIGTNDLIQLIHMAGKDPSCKGFIIRLGSLSASISNIGAIQEIREELTRAKAKGKEVFVYIEGWATLPEYFLASAADMIVMPELGTISHLGLELEVTKAKTFLNNFGLDTQIVASGEFKDTLNPNSDKIDKNERAMLESLVQRLYSQVVLDIQKSRSIDWENVSNIFDGRIISAQDAKKMGLVDRLGYWEVIEKEGKIATENAQTRDIVSIQEFADFPSRPTIFSPSNRIAVLEIDGPIRSGGNGSNIIFGGKHTGSDTINSMVKALIKDRGTKAVILRINSPGGSIIGSDHIYQAILKLRKAGKKVYASMGNMATSGGYYVAVAADKIYANPGTLTGSIGVISSFDNMEKLYEILGIDKDVIKTGKFMDMMSNSRSLTEEEIEMIASHQRGQYEIFRSRVKANRDITDEELDVIAQGQMMTGKEALDYKLIDDLGGFYEVVDDIRRDVNMDEEAELHFYRVKQPSLLNILRNIFSI